MSRQPKGRAAVVQGERRRRRDGTLDVNEDMILTLPPEFRDDKTHTYRWVNDTGYRVNSLYNKDWDTVTVSKPTGGPEDETRRRVDKNKSIEPIYAVLMRKPIELHVEDRNAVIRGTEDREDNLVRAPETNPEDADPSSPATTYVVKGTSINRRGSYAP